MVGLGLAWSAVVLSKAAMMSGWPSSSRSAVTTEVGWRLGSVGRSGRFAGRGRGVGGGWGGDGGGRAEGAVAVAGEEFGLVAEVVAKL